MIVIIIIEVIILVDLLRLRYQLNEYKKMTLEKQKARKKETPIRSKKIKPKSKIEAEDYFDDSDDFSSYL